MFITGTKLQHGILLSCAKSLKAFLFSLDICHIANVYYVKFLCMLQRYTFNIVMKHKVILPIFNVHIINILYIKMMKIIYIYICMCV